MSSINDGNQFKTVWPFGKLGRGYDLNPERYRFYVFAVRFIQIIGFVFLIVNFFLDTYLRNHFGWPRGIPFLAFLLIFSLYFGAVQLIISSAPISQVPKSAPNYGKDPALLRSVSNAKFILGVLSGAFLVIFSALGMLGEIIIHHKIEPSSLIIFVFAIAILLLLYKQRHKL